MAKYTLIDLKDVKNSAHQVARYSIEGNPDKVFMISPATHHQNMSPEERDKAFDTICERQQASGKDINVDPDTEFIELYSN